YQDQVVEVADHGNEIRDQVDRAERIGDDDCRQGFGVPRCTRIAHRQADDLSFSLQPPRADLEALEHAVHATVLSVTAYGQVARATVADRHAPLLGSRAAGAAAPVRLPHREPG